MSFKDLLPTFQKQFGLFWVQWFKASNRYSVIDSRFKSHLEDYLNHPESFKESEEAALFNSYLNSCNKDTHITEPVLEVTQLDSSKQRILKTYQIHNIKIAIYYDSTQVEALIHPALQCYEQESQTHDLQFTIYVDGDYLLLFKNDELVVKVSKSNYHVLHGKFVIELINSIHKTQDRHWIGTFHGSTVAKDNNAILCIGNSGSGKSTLCALLMSVGFKLLADDVSPLLLKNRKIYFNPLSVSIKKGAFDILDKEIQGFNTLDSVQFNLDKGLIKYVPTNIDSTNLNATCKSIVLVNYNEHSETVLEEISIKTILETLIPESWLYHDETHAEAFLDWLSEQKLLKLSYSNNAEAKQKVIDLFDSF